MQIDLEDSSEKASHIENQIAKVRANSRSTHSLERSSLSLLASANKAVRAGSFKH